MQHSDVYGGQDPREMPAYSIPEAAHYLQMPPSTLRWWVKGWAYRTEAGEQFSAPLIALPALPEKGPLLLSFVNVVEAHVLDALRRGHRIAMHRVREALKCRGASNACRRSQSAPETSNSGPSRAGNVSNFRPTQWSSSAHADYPTW